MKTKQSIKVAGSVRTKVYDLAGNLILDRTRKNMVVNLGLIALTHLLAGDNPAAAKPVEFGRIGTSAVPPAPTDGAITAHFEKPISAVSHPTPTSVRFDYAIETYEANGMNIREYGLFNDSGVMYARIVDTPIAKTPGIRVEIEWTIEFNYIP